MHEYILLQVFIQLTEQIAVAVNQRHIQLQYNLKIAVVSCHRTNSISEMVILVSGMVSEYNPISVITISLSSSSLPFAGSSPKYTPLYLAPKE